MIKEGISSKDNLKELAEVSKKAKIGPITRTFKKTVFKLLYNNLFH